MRGIRLGVPEAERRMRMRKQRRKWKKNGKSEEEKERESGEVVCSTWEEGKKNHRGRKEKSPRYQRGGG